MRLFSIDPDGSYLSLVGKTGKTIRWRNVTKWKSATLIMVIIYNLIILGVILPIIYLSIANSPKFLGFVLMLPGLWISDSILKTCLILIRRYRGVDEFVGGTTVKKGKR